MYGFRMAAMVRPFVLADDERHRVGRSWHKPPTIRRIRAANLAELLPHDLHRADEHPVVERRRRGPADGAPPWGRTVREPSLESAKAEATRERRVVGVVESRA
ncbi:hypothetical protein GCM10027427_32630 [Pseudoclavibacter terrae]